MPSIKVAVLVNSCASYCDKTLPVLLQSLNDAGVDSSKVFVVVGDCESESKESTCVSGMTYDLWRVTECNVDTTALIWAASDNGNEALQTFDYVFYLHDTTEVLPTFGKNLEDIINAIDDHIPDAVTINFSQSMSMGYYKMDALKRLRREISSLTNHDPEKRRRLKEDSEDQVFRMMRNAGMNVDYIVQSNDILSDVPNPYGGTQKRRKETWHIPGVVKYKANWGQGGLYLDV